MAASGSVLSFDEVNRLNADSEPFADTDEIVLASSRRCVRAFSRTRARVAALDDDETDYVIMTLIWALYDELWSEYVRCLAACHSAGWRQVTGSDATGSDAVVSRWLSKAQPLEGYVPRNEWERKRSYLFEAVVADRGTGRSVSGAFDDARRRWGRQLAQSADDLTAVGMRDAYVAAGIRRVRWVTQKDDRVCGTCKPRDGRTYAIDRVPSYPAHYGCRCFLLPLEPTR